MKKFYMLLLIVCAGVFAVAEAFAATEKVIACGQGYILVPVGKTDGVEMYECQKLWCRDLENGKTMGSGDKAASGYKLTSSPTPGVTDATGRHVACFGDRKWCSGQSGGRFNPEYGAYTKGGGENNSFLSVQRGDCFVWQAQKPDCDGSSQSAVMQNGQWVCVSSTGNPENIRKSSVRRTPTLRVK